MQKVQRHSSHFDLMLNALFQWIIAVYCWFRYQESEYCGAKFASQAISFWNGGEEMGIAVGIAK